MSFWNKLKIFQDHVIVVLATNIVGLLNLTLSFLILKIASKNDFNVYNALASTFLILSTPAKLLKNLTNLYGYRIVAWSNEKFKFNKTLVLLTSFVLLASASLYTSYSTQSNLFVGIFVVLTAIFQTAFLILVGSMQNEKKFIKSSTYLFAVNLLRLLFCTLAFHFFANTGFWLINFIVTSLIFYISYNSIEFSTSSKIEIKLEMKDILINLSFMILLEIAFNIDSILVLHNLSPSDAHIYNSFGIIKSSIFYAALGVGTVVLSNSRKSLLANTKSLTLNVFVTSAIGIIFGFFAILFEKNILEILGVDIAYSLIYMKFIGGTFLFTVFLTIALWFTSLEKFMHRVFAMVFLGIFIIYYSLSITSLDNILNSFIYGLLALIFSYILLIIHHTWSEARII